jgi:pimeloyl-ACP methyl ester carboxylesterase
LNVWQRRWLSGKPLQLEPMEMQRSGMENHEIEVNGERLRYLQSGSGPPLLLLHGLLGGSFCWRLNVAAFSQRHTVLALDLPGLGDCGVPRQDVSRQTDCSMQAQATRLDSLLEKLKLGPVDVVGSSWGGAVAIFLAARSSKVRSLVLAAPVNPWSNFGAGRIRFLNGRLGKMLLPLALPLSRPLHLTAIQRMYGDPRRVPPGTLEGYSSQLLRPGRAHNILNTMSYWQKDITALRDSIPRVNAPSLLIWGTRDGAVDLRSSEPLMQAMPGCQLALIEGAGHLPFEERPEEFNRLVLDFLERVNKSGGAKTADQHDLQAL